MHWLAELVGGGDRGRGVGEGGGGRGMGGGGGGRRLGLGTESSGSAAGLTSVAGETEEPDSWAVTWGRWGLSTAERNL
jgi:hypothetical protein